MRISDWSSDVCSSDLHLAVDRHLVARAHAQAIAMLNPLERNFLLVAAGAHPSGGLRRKIEKRTQRAAGPLAGAQLQHLTEQDQHNDYGGHLIIDAKFAGRIAKRGGKDRKSVV